MIDSTIVNAITDPKTVVAVSVVSPIIAGLIAFALMIIGKVMPKEKLAGLLTGLAPAFVTVLTFGLLRFLPKKQADQFEEAIFVTIFYSIGRFCDRVVELFRADNEKKPETKQTTAASRDRLPD